jgi:serine/threonine protein phosphatase PrpC
MSRSIGDSISYRAGVIYEPDITEITVSGEDKMIVLASDGVWEYLSNLDVANIVFPFFNDKCVETAAETLVKSSYYKWKQVRSNSKSSSETTQILMI